MRSWAPVRVVVRVGKYDFFIRKFNSRLDEFWSLS